jgi:diguanylate cyclase (GGDEF)-like protein
VPALVNRSRPRSRPYNVTILAVAQFVCAGAFLLAAAVPPSLKVTRLSDSTMAGWATVSGLYLWILGQRVPAFLLHATLASDTIWISSVVFRSPTEDAAVITTFGYPWIGIYAACFCSRRAMQGHLALMAICFAVALGFAELPSADVVNKLIIWLIVVITSAAMAFVIGHLIGTLRTQAERDHLTGLLNRQAFTAIAEHSIARATRTGEPLTLAILDLDGFKEVNDNQGHEAGDGLLVEVARIWSEHLRASDALGRLGGDEFVVLMPGIGADEAEAALARLRAVSPIPWSVGVAERLEGEVLSEWTSRADAALYACKRSRRQPA